MPAQLQINCNSDDWNASVITVVGIPHEQRILQPRTIAALNLPSDLFAIWQQTVQYFRTLDPAPDGCAAAHIIAEKKGIILQHPDEETAEQHTQLRCSIARIWTSDDTTAPPITQYLDTSEMLAFFDTLTSASFWLARQ